MGFDLTGGESFNWHSWRGCLDVAKAFGWKPAGTAPPPPEHRPPNAGGRGGGYFSNDFQSVTESDAKDLSRALFRAINAVQTGRLLPLNQHLAIKEVDLSEVTRLANHAFRGGFTIY